MLFSFSKLNQDFNCFSFPSYIIFPFSSRNRFIISFPKRNRRNSIPINTLYKGVDYYCYMLIDKSLLEMFSLLFCLLTQFSCRNQVSWKSCSNYVLQILLLYHAHTTSVGIRARLGSYYAIKRSTWGKTCCHR